MPDQPRKTLFVEWPATLHHKVRVAAVTSGKTMRQWVEEAALAKLAGSCPCEDSGAEKETTA